MVISKNNLLNKEFDMRSTLFYPSHPVLDDMVQEFFGNAFGNTKAVSKYPLTDVYTKDGLAYLEIAIAGFSKDEIKIELNEDSLRILIFLMSILILSLMGLYFTYLLNLIGN